MKTMERLCRRGFLCLVAILAFQATGARADEFSKKYHEEYAANKNTKLSVENKYGNVTVKNWNENRVVIDVTVTVESGDKAKAEKILNYINVEFNHTGDEISAITKLDDKFNSSSVFDSGDKKRISIDYTLNIPTDLTISLVNKYGDVVINELTGLSDITIKYGNLKAGKILRKDIKPLSQVTLAYANGIIDECNWLKTDLKYSKLTIGKCQALVAVSKYSKVNIEESSSIVSEAKYDTYEIGNLSNFVGTGAYCTYRFGEVSHKLNLSIRYSDCKVTRVPNDFESIDIKTAYGGIKIGIDPGASYRLTGKADFAKIVYPDQNAKVSRISENTSMSVNGLIGKDEHTKSTVKIDTDFGNVSLIK